MAFSFWLYFTKVITPNPNVPFWRISPEGGEQVKVTEVRIKLMNGSRRNGDEKLKAFCSVTLDGAFVIRDLKVIQGSKGLFVAMPSRKVMSHCPNCQTKNCLQAHFCNDCGKKLPRISEEDAEGARKRYADIVHPVHSQARKLLHDAVLEAFQREIKTSKGQSSGIPRPPHSSAMASPESEFFEGEA
jgi:stage V sporulation protein G